MDKDIREMLLADQREHRAKCFTAIAKFKDNIGKGDFHGYYANLLEKEKNKVRLHCRAIKQLKKLEI